MQGGPLDIADLPRNHSAAACALSPLLALQHLLDDVGDALTRRSDVRGAIQTLTDGLRTVKDRVSKRYWTSVVIPAVRDHPISRSIYQCPLTRHARARPRGYPGDADLLDLIYYHHSADARVREASATGKAIYAVTAGVSACESVRERRRIVARKIDEAAAMRPGAAIMSMACGHLREAELSVALHNDRIGSLTALDQDPLSLSSVEAYTAATGGRVRPLRITVRDIIAGKHDLPRFDFIYSAGLYDYLQDSTAARLTRRLFDLLGDGGTLLVANFLDGIWEAPYMEAFMDWHLMYRSEQGIRALARDIPPEEVSSQSYWSDSSRRIGYLELSRT